jgi:hypothetical protein
MTKVNPGCVKNSEGPIALRHSFYIEQDRARRKIVDARIRGIEKKIQTLKLIGGVTALFLVTRQPGDGPPVMCCTNGSPLEYVQTFMDMYEKQSAQEISQRKRGVINEKSAVPKRLKVSEFIALTGDEQLPQPEADFLLPDFIAAFRRHSSIQDAVYALDE